MNVFIFLYESVASILVENVIENLAIGVNDFKKFVNVYLLPGCV